MKQLINKLASWSYNQACLKWQLCLLVKYNIKANSLCVCVYVCVAVGEEINWYWHIYDALADTMSLKWLGQLFRQWCEW